MELLIWIGATVSLVGLAGIIASAVMVVRARRRADDDAALRLRLNRILPINLGALFLSVIGLMLVLTGVLLA